MNNIVTGNYQNRTRVGHLAKVCCILCCILLKCFLLVLLNKNELTFNETSIRNNLHDMGSAAQKTTNCYIYNYTEYLSGLQSFLCDLWKQQRDFWKRGTRWGLFYPILYQLPHILPVTQYFTSLSFQMEPNHPQSVTIFNQITLLRHKL